MLNLTKINQYPIKAYNPIFKNTYHEVVTNYIGKNFGFGWVIYLIYKYETFFIDTTKYDGDEIRKRALQMVPNNNTVLKDINKKFNLNIKSPYSNVGFDFVGLLDSIFTPENLEHYIDICVACVRMANKSEDIAKKYMNNNGYKTINPTIAEDLNGIDFFVRNKTFQVKNTDVIINNKGNEIDFELTSNIKLNNVPDYIIVVTKKFDKMYIFNMSRNKIDVDSKKIITARGKYTVVDTTKY
jgi:hypothetical protein